MTKVATKKPATVEISKPEETLPEVTEPTTIPIAKLIELRTKNPNLTYQQIGDMLGCSKVNVINRLKPYKEEIESLPTFKKSRGDILALVQSKLLNSLTLEDIKGASLLQKVTAMGVLYDKERLETGQSTSNTSVLSHVVEGLHEKL